MKRAEEKMRDSVDCRLHRSARGIIYGKSDARLYMELADKVESWVAGRIDGSGAYRAGMTALMDTRLDLEVEEDA